MKFTMTKFELFTVTTHLVSQPSPSPEHGRKRLRAWDELGVADLADRLATMTAGFGGEITVADWSDKTAPIDVDLTHDTVAYLISGLGMQAQGVWADTVTRVRDRLEKAKG
jgi:hypothetical protein